MAMAVRLFVLSDENQNGLMLKTVFCSLVHYTVVVRGTDQLLKVFQHLEKTVVSVSAVYEELLLPHRSTTLAK